MLEARGFSMEKVATLPSRMRNVVSHFSNASVAYMMLVEGEHHCSREQARVSVAKAVLITSLVDCRRHVGKSFILLFGFSF
jgi:hypothetical protein